MRHEVDEACERRETAAPAFVSPLDAEVEPGYEGPDSGAVDLGQRDRGFRQDEWDVPLQADTEALAMVRDQVVARSHVDVDVVAAQLDRKAPKVVCPLVERTSGAQVEASVVPVAREDAVGDSATVQREAHVWAPVVDGVHRITVREQAERVPVNVQDEAPSGLKLGKRRCAHMLVRLSCCHLSSSGRGDKGDAVAGA